MAFTTAELALVNQALGKIGSTTISLAENGSDKCDTYAKSFLHYAQTRDSLMRSFEWTFASDRAELAKINNLTLNVRPLPSDWSVGDTITGLTSFATADILTVTSDTEYEIIYLSGAFLAGETITDGTVEEVFWEGIEVLYEGATVLWHDTANDITCITGYPIATEVAPSFEWDHQYRLPDDYSRLKSVYEDKGYDREHRRYAIEGKSFLTNYDAAHICYIKKITDPAEFDSLFIEILILQLALKLLGPLAGTQTTMFKQGLQLELKDAMARARAVCRIETETKGRSGWNLARYSYGKPSALSR
jgi:hypothetical protein